MIIHEKKRFSLVVAIFNITGADPSASRSSPGTVPYAEMVTFKFISFHRNIRIQCRTL